MLIFNRLILRANLLIHLRNLNELSYLCATSKTISCLDEKFLVIAVFFFSQTSYIRQIEDFFVVSVLDKLDFRTVRAQCR